MRASPGQRMAQIVALWQSGDLARASVGARSAAEVAKRLGMTPDALKGAIEGARNAGHAIPPLELLARSAEPARDDGSGSYGAPYPAYGVANDSSTGRYRGQSTIDESLDFADEELTRPVIPTSEPGPDIKTPNVGMYTATVQWPQLEQQPIAEPQQQRIALDSGTTVSESSTRAWPHVEAFDAVGNDMLPAHGPGVRRSTLLRDGEPVLQWIKNPGGADPNAIVEAAKRALVTLPFVEPAPAPTYTDDELLAVYPIGDAHVGMLAWEPEAGANFDLKIAERDLTTCIDRLSMKAPAAKRALIANVGDFIHSDGPKGQTTRGTPVDVDGRWPKVIETAMRIQRRMIELALRKHEHVTVINARGNHDETAAVIMALSLAQFYENEPRVHIDTSPEFFHWYRFEKNFIGVHHSEKVKTPSDLLGVMAVDQPQHWGETTHRSFILGHLHHLIAKMEKTVRFDWVPTLAGADAWHRAMGYRACQELRVDVHHARFGLIDRHVVGLDEVRALQESA